MAVIDVNRGAKRAREARAQLGLDPASPLPCLLGVVEERAERPVVVAPLAPGLAGACVPFGTGRLLFVNGAQAPVRQRFTLAHELGHAWCGHDGTVAVDTFATLGGGVTTPYEVQANAFAAEFLIPKVALVELADGEPGLDEITLVAAHFGTSAVMTLFRYRQLRLISGEACDELKARIDEGEHFAAAERLGLAAFADRLATLDPLPYLSPVLRGTRLAAVLEGAAPAEPALAKAISRLLGG